jgi:hypothetical protein
MKEINPIVCFNGKKFIEIFSLEELSENAKKNAIENYRELYESTFNDISIDLEDNFKEHLNPLGFPVDDIRWSLSYSQGDGIAFYGKIDIETLLEARPELKECIPICLQFIDGYNKIPSFGHSLTKISDWMELSLWKCIHFYNHQKSMDTDVNVYEQDLDAMISTMEKYIDKCLLPDDEVDMDEWSFKQVDENKWTIENPVYDWNVTIDKNQIVTYESPEQIPDAVKKAFQEKTSSNNSYSQEPDFHISPRVILSEIESLEKAIKVIAAETSVEMKKKGYELYEDMISDEAMTDIILANEIMFDVAGDIIQT